MQKKKNKRKKIRIHYKFFKRFQYYENFKSKKRIHIISIHIKIQKIIKKIIYYYYLINHLEFFANYVFDKKI